VQPGGGGEGDGGGGEGDGGDGEGGGGDGGEGEGSTAVAPHVVPHALPHTQTPFTQSSVPSHGRPGHAVGVQSVDAMSGQLMVP
jgi:hypothetical protein